MRFLLCSTALLATVAAPLEAQRLISLEANRTVSELDPATAARTVIGNISSNAGTTGGFAYDPAGRLYLTSTSLDSLYLVDVTNWQAKLIGNYSLASVVMHGLEFDSSTNTLYGGGNAGDFYTIDTATGAATLAATTTLTGFQNFGYDPVFDVMYVTSTGTDSLYTIDRSTGATTLIGAMNGPTNPHGLAYNLSNLTLYLVCSSTDTLYTLDLTTGAATAVGQLGSGNYLGLVYIPGTGRLTRDTHGCGPSSIFVTGSPNIGGTVDFTVDNATGFPFVGFGVSPLGLPFCGCTVGHEWAVAALGPTVSLPIPPDPSLVGVSVYAQGLDFAGTGGCADPLLATTDTITVTIGN